MSEIVEKKKRRGRKPKNIISVNENPIFDNNIDNNIVKLSKKKNIKIDELKSYNDNDTIYNLNENNSSSLCWNCCHEITGIHKSIPIKYVNGIYSLYGNFCSYECGARFLTERYNGCELWDKYTLLNYYIYSKIGQDKSVSIAPDRLNLKLFGGNMDIETYRMNSINDSNDIYIPPINHINHIRYKEEHIDKEKNSKNTLRLYRKTDIINKGNIINTMNIEKSKEI